MDQVTQAVFIASLVKALWVVVAPVVVLMIAQLGIGIVNYIKQGELIKQHQALHVEHKTKLEEHSKQLNHHATKIAVLESVLD